MTSFVCVSALSVYVIVVEGLKGFGKFSYSASSEGRAEAACTNILKLHFFPLSSLSVNGTLNAASAGASIT